MADIRPEQPEDAAAIQRVTDADMQRLATSVFPAAKRIAVIVEVEK